MADEKFDAVHTCHMWELTGERSEFASQNCKLSKIVTSVANSLYLGANSLRNGCNTVSAPDQLCALSLAGVLFIVLTDLIARANPS